MKMRKRITSIIVYIMLILYCMPVLPVAANSASISISMVSEQAIEGSNCTLAVLISSDANMASLNMTINYDREYLELISDNPLYEKFDSGLTINDPDLGSKGIKERKYIIQFKTLKKGKTTVSVEGAPQIYESSNGAAFSISKKDFNLTIYDKDKKSDNNKLSNLSVKEGEFTTKFDPDKLVYELHIPYDKSYITVSAEPEDSSASVAIAGNEKLNVGANKVTVIVTSESGKGNEYIIYVNRGELEEEDEVLPTASIEPIEPSNTPIPILSEINPGNSYEIMKDNGLTYFVGNTTYLLLEPYDNSNVPKGYERVELEVLGTVVTAYALDGDSYADFVLLYAKQEGKDPYWYQFDRQEGTLQRFRYELMQIDKEVKDSATLKEIEEYQERIDTFGLVIGIEAGFVILFLILLIRLYMRQKGYNDELE